MKKINGYYSETFLALAVIVFLLLSRFDFINVLVYLLILFSILVFKINTSLLIYIALLPWERTFSFQTSLSFLTIFQFAFLAKILLSLNIIKPKFSVFNVLFISLFIMIGFVSFYISSSLSGLGISIDLFIAVLLFYYIRNNSKYGKNILDNIQLTSIISLCFSLIYGIVYSLYSIRWIDGLGYAPLFRGVLESNETALYINIALLFLYSIPLRKIYKVVLFIFLVTILLWTLSFTGLFVFLLVLMLVVTFGIGNSKKGFFTNIFKTFIVVLLIVLFTYLMKDSIPIFYRISNVIDDLLAFDFSSATSGRTDLFNKYEYYYKQLNLFNKLFGTSFRARDYILRFEYSSFSHNTFLDLLFYMGWFGIALLFVYINNIIKKTLKFNDIINQYIYLKIILIISGLSLSLSNYNFWFFWLFI